MQEWVYLERMFDSNTPGNCTRGEWCSTRDAISTRLVTIDMESRRFEATWHASNEHNTNKGTDGTQLEVYLLQIM